jgi:hypothetical protein
MTIDFDLRRELPLWVRIEDVVQSTHYMGTRLSI